MSENFMHQARENDKKKNNLQENTQEYSRKYLGGLHNVEYLVKFEPLNLCKKICKAK